jgi:hypothetical protein
MSPLYWISRDIFPCLSEGHLLCLNVRTGDLYRLPPVWLDLINVVGWPRIEDATRRSQSIGDELTSSSFVTSELLRLGVIVTERRRGKDAALENAPPPEGALLDEYELVPVCITARDVWRFVKAAVSAMWILRSHDPNRQLGALWKHVSTPRPPDTPYSDVEQMRTITSIFRRLRPILSTRANQAFFERLVLWKMLRSYGLNASFIIGVSADPLRIHVWLQNGSLVVDEAVGIARSFSPVAIA